MQRHADAFHLALRLTDPAGADDVQSLYVQSMREVAGGFVAGGPHALLVHGRLRGRCGARPRDGYAFLLLSCSPDPRAASTSQRTGVDALPGSADLSYRIRDRIVRWHLPPPGDATAGRHMSGGPLTTLGRCLGQQRSAAFELVNLLERTPWLRLAEAAGELGCSARTLQRELHPQGLSFPGLRQATKLLRGMRLLGQGMDPSEAATEAGFYDYPHFARALRRSSGLTPASYQRDCIDRQAGVAAPPTPARQLVRAAIRLR